MNRKEQIECLKNEVCKKFGRTVEVSSDFSALSLSIQETTSESVSPSTLKRIFGYVKYGAEPSVATLSILSRYVGYAGWSDFCEKRTGEDSKVQGRTGRRLPIWMIALFSTVAMAAACVVIIVLKPRDVPKLDSLAGRKDTLVVLSEGDPVEIPVKDPVQIKYDSVLCKCLSESKIQCDTVLAQYGKMDIVDYWHYVNKEYSRIVFTDIKKLVEEEVGKTFPDEVECEIYGSEIFSKCRDYCVNKLFVDFPKDELQAAFDRLSYNKDS
ncbi:MAG: hypothetical protein IAB93_03955 [Bacteroidetes bacterium]|uniref:Uncharacterized protein n=1 Tax=Candidatus Merdivivens pullistercoris TaxID=2840873 RepID=A0A9D9I376_9BACT|nr:hypothetical protein [Candidatus Merdivivens pullistercoris]